MPSTLGPNSFKVKKYAIKKELKNQDTSLDKEMFLGLSTFEEIESKFNAYSQSAQSFSALKSVQLYQSQNTPSKKVNDSNSSGKVTFAIPTIVIRSHARSASPQTSEKVGSFQSQDEQKEISTRNKSISPENRQIKMIQILSQAFLLKNDGSNSITLQKQRVSLKQENSSPNKQISNQISANSQQLNNQRVSFVDFSSLQKNIQKMKNVDIIKSSLEQIEQNSKHPLTNQTIDKLSQFIYEFSSATMIQLGSLSTFEIERIFNLFGIEKKKFMKMQSSEDKEMYLVSSIQRTCKEQLEQFMQKIEQRTQIVLKSEEAAKRKEEKNKRIGNQFSWMKINCEKIVLKKKLQLSLVQVLYQNNNLEKLIAKNDEYKSQQRDFGKQKSPRQRTFRLNISNSTATHGKIRASSLTERKETKEDGQQQQYVKEEGVMQQIDIENEKQLQNKLSKFFWSDEIERTFQSYKKEAKTNMGGCNNTFELQSIGLQPIIQMLGLEEKLDLFREQLMSKFRNNEKILNESEKLFLVNTSELLNSNIDREGFQEMIDFISPQDIYQLELKIAENTLSKYANIKQQLKAIRNVYLRNKATTTQKLNQSIYSKGTCLEDLKKGNDLKLKQRLLKIQVDKTRKLLKLKAKSIEYFEQLRKNPYVMHFVRQMKKIVAYKQHHKNILQFEEPAELNNMFAKRNYPQKQNKPMFSFIDNNQQQINISSQKSLKINHPSSRLLLGLKEHKKAEQMKKNGEERSLSPHELKQFNELEIQLESNNKFTNRLQDSKFMQADHHQFVEYYSCGPKNVDLLNLQKDNRHLDESVIIQAKLVQNKGRRKVFNEQEIITQAVVIIQKWARMIIQKLNYQNAFFLKKKQQEKSIFSILKKWKESKELLNFLKEERLKKNELKKQQFLRANSKLNELFTSKSNQQYIQNEISTEKAILKTKNTERSDSLSSTSSNRNIQESQINQVKVLGQEKRKIKKIKLNESINTTSDTNTRSASRLVSSRGFQSPRRTEHLQQAESGFLKIKKEREEVNNNSLNCSNSNGSLASKSPFQLTRDSSQKKREKTISPDEKQKQKKEILFKQKKLLQIAKDSNLSNLKQSGFVYKSYDLDATDSKGNCALYYVIKRGLIDFAYYLIHSKANPNIKCEKGSTPLHVAFELGNQGLIISLIDAGGDLNIINNMGQTPLCFGKQTLLQDLGLEKGVSQLNLSNGEEQNEYKMNFDNNKLFNSKHDSLFDNPLYLKLPASYVKRKKELKVEEEIPGQQDFSLFIHGEERPQFISKNGGIQTSRSNQKQNTQIFQQSQKQ